MQIPCLCTQKHIRCVFGVIAIRKGPIANRGEMRLSGPSSTDNPHTLTRSELGVKGDLYRKKQVIQSCGKLLPRRTGAASLYGIFPGGVAAVLRGVPIYIGRGCSAARA